MTVEKSVSENAYSITADELLAIGLTLNDGMERGWLRTLAMLLKKNPLVGLAQRGGRPAGKLDRCQIESCSNRYRHAGRAGEGGAPVCSR